MDAILLLMWLTLPALSLAQVSTSATSTPAMAANGAFFALSVADVRASAKWYRKSWV